jgi:uncharacterized protein (DUF697 family)
MATRARKTMMTNPLDEISGLSVLKQTGIDSEVATSSTAKKAATKTVKKTSAKKVIIKKTSSTKKPTEQMIAPKANTVQKRVSKKNRPLLTSQEKETDTSSFDDLAKIVVDHASKDAEMKRKSQDNAQLQGRATPQQRADEVFEAELSQEPVRELVRMAVTSDRETRGMKVVKSWAQWSVAAGFVPVPFVDIALVSGIQIKMIYDLCQIYNVPFKKESAIAYASGLVGGSLTAGAAQVVGAMALKAVPYVDQIVQPTFAFATTYAMGYVFVKHFENAGTMTSFDSSKMNLYFQEQFEKSKKMFSKKQAAPA